MLAHTHVPERRSERTEGLSGLEKQTEGTQKVLPEGRKHNSSTKLRKVESQLASHLVSYQSSG